MGRRDGGMVTAELAVAIPVVVVVLVLALGAVRLGIEQVRCVDAARLAVRALARGDAEGDALAQAARAGPPGARTSLHVGAAEVTVEVSASGELWGWRVLTVRGSAVAQREQP